MRPRNVGLCTFCHEFGKHATFRMSGLTVLVLISILSLSTLVRAGEPCLLIAMPEVRMTGDGIEPYRSAMQQGGLCVKPARMPLARVAQALSHGEVDGVFAELEGFQQNVDRPILRGNIRVGLVDGMLVVPLGKISGIDDLYRLAPSLTHELGFPFP